MRSYYLKRILLTAVAVVFFTSLFAQPANVFLIGGPVNKNNPNWLLEQKVQLTKDPANPHLFYFKGHLAYNWRGDEKGNIKFLTGNTWSDSFHPDSDSNLALQGITSVRQNGSDSKWFIPADRSGDGYYELTLNTQAMTLKVDLFRHDLHPEKIYAVGGAMPCGWNNNNPMEMTRTNPLIPVYTWTGTMISGDFKFLHPLSIGNWDFCYDATIQNEPVSFGTAQNLVFEVRNSTTSFNDYKFVMNQTAECTITVDLVNMKMTVTKNGDLYAQNIWITGSAVPGGKVKLVSDNIDPLINYHYYGQLQAGEFKFSTTEVPDATTKYYVPASATDAVSDNISVNLTSDATATGWTVSQANDMYKIKLNTLSKKYKGWIFGVERLYIVGGATAAGWNAGNAIELTKGTGDQANVYTFDGSLRINADGNDRNKFKFLLQRDWGPYSFHAPTENASITGAQYFTDRRSDDYKWTVDEDKQGRYVIKINALEETIEATYFADPSTGLAKNEMNTKVFAGSGKIIVQADTEASKTIEVFIMDGRCVAKKLFTREVEISLTKGIYVVKISDGSSNTITEKVSIIK